MKIHLVFCHICLLCFFIPFAAHAADPVDQIDSLKSELKTLPLDTQYVMTLVELSIRFENLQPDTALTYAENALELARELKDDRTIAHSLGRVARVKTQLGQLEEALDEYQRCLALWEALGNRREIARACNGIGILYAYMGDLETGLEYFKKGLANQPQLKDSADSYHNIGVIYHSIGQYDSAMVYFLEGVAGTESLGNPEPMAASYLAIGMLHLDMGNLDKALSYTQKSLEMYRKTDNRISVAEALINLGIIYDHQEADSIALLHYQEGWELSRELGFVYGEASAAVSMGGVYRSLGNWEKAEEHSLSGLALANELGSAQLVANAEFNLGKIAMHKEQPALAAQHLEASLASAQQAFLAKETKEAHEYLGEVYAELGRYKEAYHNRTAYARLNDSLLSEEKNQQIAKMEGEFRHERDEANLIKLERDQALSEAKEARNSIFFAILITALIFFLLLTGLAVWFWLRSRHQNRIIRENEQRVIRLNETQNLLFSIIGHDLRAPFHALSRFSKLMESDPNSSLKVRSAFQLVNQTSRNTFDTFENLLKWTKAQSGELEYKPEAIPLATPMKEILSPLKADVDGKNLRINTDLDGYWVMADPNMLSAILRNLLSNAVRYADPGTEVTVWAVKNGSWLECSVQNTAVGANVGQIRKMLHEGPQKGHLGSSLGLRICREFVERHGGKIGVSSLPGNQLVIQVSLPFATSGEANLVTSASLVSGRARHALSDRNRKVLEPFLPKLKTLPLYQVSKLYQQLDQIDTQGEPELENWVEELRSAIDQMDEKRAQELLNLGESLTA